MKSNLVLILLFIGFANLFAQYDIYDTDAFITAAESHVSKDELKKAMATYENVHPSDPKYLQVQTQIGYILLSQENYEGTIERFKPLYEEGRFKESPQLYVILGTAYSSNDQLDMAIKVYKEGEKYTPDYGTLMYNLAVVYGKKEDFENTLHYLKRTMDTNPNITSAHFILSNLAFDRGQIGLGSLAALAYLANEPEGRYSGDMILAINSNMGSHYLEESDDKFSEKGDDFSNLDLILRNEFPLSSKYKLNCDIDDVITRNTQAIVEYAVEHKIKDGYFENIYIPYLADIHKKKLTENFQYWNLQQLTGDLAKTIKKNKDKLVEYSEEYYQKGFWDVYSARTVDHFGEQKKVNFVLDNNVPFLICKINNGEITGYAKFVDELGRTTGKVQYKNGKLNGKGEYYEDDGTLGETRIFVDGEINGDNIYYNKEGTKVAIYPYKDGEIDGLVKTYFANGDQNCNVEYTNGELDGEYNCKYKNGKTKFDLKYKGGKLNGEALTYAPDGTLTEKEFYKDDLLDGQCTYFNPNNGEQTSKVRYSEGDPIASYKRKDKSGLIDFEFIKKGDQQELRNYTMGKIETCRFLEKDVMVKQELFDDEKKYLDLVFKDDKITSLTQYSANNTKGKKLNASDAKVYTYDEVLKSHLRYKNGELDGDVEYYYGNGNKRSEISYDQGDETGESTFYDSRGNKTRVYNIISDSLNGLYTSYDLGTVTDEYNYAKGQASGPYVAYWPNGKTRYKGFFYQDKEHGKTKSYRTDGTLRSIQEYKYGEFDKVTFYDKNEKVDVVKDYTKTGAQSLTYTSRPIIEKYILKNKLINGPYSKISTNGDTMFMLNYVNGKRDGYCKYYSPIGKVRTEGLQKNNKYQGLIKNYDAAGALFVNTMYIDSDENGEETYYYPNGKKRISRTNIDDEVEGEQLIYNYKQEVIAKLLYKESLVQSYWVIGQEEGTMLPVGNKKIEGKYPNGTTAISFKCKDQYYDGPYAIYAANGKPIYEVNFKNGVFDGNRTMYREDGQKYYTTSYINNDRVGNTKYYDKNGKVLLSYNSQKGLLHGDYEIYNNGVLTKTKVYFDDELIELK